MPQYSSAPRKASVSTKAKTPPGEAHASNAPNAALELLLTRRSVIANRLSEPGPDGDQLEKILQAGLRVPDHKILAPWRFIRFQGETRRLFGAVLSRRLQQQDPSASPDRLAIEANRFLRAPVVIAVISKVEMGVVPEWEQILSAGAVCQNMLHAAHALGFSAQWITEWYAYDPVITKALHLAGNERVAGFIYIGSAQEKPKERRRPELSDLLSDWQPADTSTE